VTADGAGTEVELVEDVAALERHREDWDRLAVTLGQPYSAPAWMLAWWRHAVPGRAQLRTVVVREEGRLVGLAPFFVQLGRWGLAEYRLLGAGNSHRIGILAEPQREQEVAQAVATALAACAPRPSSVVFEGVDAGSPWPRLLQRAWPGFGRPRLREGLTMTAPTLRVQGGTFDDWFAECSSHFRQHMRRYGRRLQEAGGQIRRTRDERELETDLRAFVELHYGCWVDRGGSNAVDPSIEAMLRASADELLSQERFRLWIVEIEGRPVCAQLYIAAGEELASWGIGFDPEWSKLRPAQLATEAAVRDLFERGERRLDFGGGDYDYKWRFADSDEPVVWMSMFPRNRRYLLTRAQLLPKEFRQAARRLARRTPDRLQKLLRRLLRR
jgi:CelD/BcsL family acetyltransferase involved in cellulose biosynthesis